MKKSYCIELDDFDLGQVLDGLEIRAAAWENTADYHRTGESPPDFIVTGHFKTSQSGSNENQPL